MKLSCRNVVLEQTGAAAVAWIHRQGRLVRVVGKTRFAMKYLGGAEDKPWVSKARKKEAEVRKRKENEMLARDYRPSFQVVSRPALSMATLALQYQVNCWSCFPDEWTELE